MKKKKLVIVGGGGHAKVLLDILLKVKEYEVIGITDKSGKLQHGAILGVPYIGDDDLLPSLCKQGVEYAFVGLGSSGDNFPRARLYYKIKQLGFRLINIIHPQTIIADSVSIGEGNAIMAGAIINPGVTIGNNVIINTGAIVEHDCIIRDHVHICPGASCAGALEIGEYSHIGIGVAVKQCLKIGKNVTVGVGSVVIKDIPDNVVVAGVPVKVIGRS